MLAKSNMAEFAFSPYETVSSILPGYTKNPYALDRVTAGSSGGTAAAVAANFGAIGLGSDTGNSIRGPASHQALAGIRSTMGLTSRAGVVPLNLLADIAGPMTRTLEDAVAVLQVIAGPDPDDPVTVGDTAIARAFSPGGHPAEIPNYLASLRKDGLKGRRIGILRQAYERDTTDAEIVKVFMAAVDDMKRAGAVIVDPVRVDLDEIKRAQGVGTCGGFKYDINRWLASHGDRVPVKDLAAIIQSRQFHPSVQRRLEQAQEAHRERTRYAGMPGGIGIPSAGARGSNEDDGRGKTRRVRVPNLEQPSTADWRSEHPARRQQSVLLARDGIPVNQRADGLYAGRHATGRRDVLRPRVGRGWTHRLGVLVRAGDKASEEADYWQSVVGRRESRSRQSSRQSESQSSRQSESQSESPVRVGGSTTTTGTSDWDCRLRLSTATADSTRLPTEDCH